MLSIGLLYYLGQGVEMDREEAARWLRKAAEGGNIRAMTNLAHMYDGGRGIEKNPAEAKRWREAAEEARKRPSGP